ncbi:hypothetical protein ACJJTC_010583 [Scirpophaga incertulas]
MSSIKEFNRTPGFGRPRPGHHTQAKCDDDLVDTDSFNMIVETQPSRQQPHPPQQRKLRCVFLSHTYGPTEMQDYYSEPIYSAVVSPIEVEPTNDEIEVQAIHTPPIDKELKNELMTKHVAFENISMLPPKLNPEKVAAVSEPVKKRDLIIAKTNMKESLTGDTDSFLFGSDLSEKIKITKAVQKSVKDLRINASNKPTITPKTKSLNWRAPPRSSARTVTGGRQNLPK